MSEILITTALKRPYVVAFLLSYLIIAWRITGPKWTLIYLFVGYGIAFASEYLSINFGFPYGWYTYVYENLRGEWLNHGVPVWDSVSYVFMNFAGLCTAYLAVGCPANPTLNKKIALVLYSALFVMLLDVVIDPVAHLGERWFLGKIYYYPHPGFYFDVTLANFAGWYLTSLLVNSFAVFALGFAPRENLSPPLHQAAALGLYYGIFAFGLVIALYLKQWGIVISDLFWISLTIGLIRWSSSFSRQDYP